MRAWAILLAAGQGSRMLESCGGVQKQFFFWNGAPLFWYSARMFSRVARIRGLVFVFSDEEMQTASGLLHTLDPDQSLGLPWLLAHGGARRQDSVANGLAMVPKECDAVLIHDAARPFASATLANSVLDALQAGARGVVPVIPVTDTIKVITGNTITHTPDRTTLVAAQTPQGFQKDALLHAHAQCRSQGWSVTDDASAMERCFTETVQTVQGQVNNIKITTPEDMNVLESSADQQTLLPCTGWGYDVHRFSPEGKPMKLGGVPIAGGPPVLAHSDGDVLLHALMDAILGCMGMGDIGLIFPDSDQAFENADSAVLLTEVLEKAHNQGLVFTHMDLTIITQIPRIAPWHDQIHKNISRLTRLAPHSVNLKATTEEKLGFTGEKKGIKAVATVTALRPATP